MSRASGAGAYSHGIAWPSPMPHEVGAGTSRRVTARSVLTRPLWHRAIVVPPLPLGYAAAMRRLAGARELLDGPLDDPAALRGNLRDLARINRWFGGTRRSRRALDRLLGRRTGAPHAARRGHGGRRHPARPARRRREARAPAARHGGGLAPGGDRRGARGRPADRDGRRPRARGVATAGRCPGRTARSTSSTPRSWSITSSRAEAIAFLRGGGAGSRGSGVVVNDLVRARRHWLGARVLLAAMTRNRYTRHDGPLSVRRAYTRVELRALLAGAGLRPVARDRRVRRAPGRDRRRPDRARRTPASTDRHAGAATAITGGASTSSWSAAGRRAPRSRRVLARAGREVVAARARTRLALARRWRVRIAGGRRASSAALGLDDDVARAASRARSRRCASSPRRGDGVPAHVRRRGAAASRRWASTGPRSTRRCSTSRATRGRRPARRRGAGGRARRPPRTGRRSRADGRRRPEALEARVVVGADGPRSIVARGRGHGPAAAARRPRRAHVARGGRRRRRPADADARGWSCSPDGAYCGHRAGARRPGQRRASCWPARPWRDRLARDGAAATGGDALAVDPAAPRRRGGVARGRGHRRDRGREPARQPRRAPGGPGLAGRRRRGRVPRPVHRRGPPPGARLGAARGRGDRRRTSRGTGDGLGGLRPGDAARGSRAKDLVSLLVQSFLARPSAVRARRPTARANAMTSVRRWAS